MKTNHLPYLLFTILIAIIACKTISEQPSIENSLIGQWKFTSTSGGFAGKTTQSDPANPIILTFKKDGSYSKTKNADTIEQSTYEFTRAKSIYSGQEENAIRLGPLSSSKIDTYIITIKKDTLILADNVYDGFTSGYLRIK
jgi:hypothetical protein